MIVYCITFNTSTLENACLAKTKATRRQVASLSVRMEENLPFILNHSITNAEINAGALFVF